MWGGQVSRQHYGPAHAHKPELTDGFISPGLTPSPQGTKWQRVNQCGGYCHTAQLEHHRPNSTGMALGCRSLRWAPSLPLHPYSQLSQGTGVLWQAWQRLFLLPERTKHAHPLQSTCGHQVRPSCAGKHTGTGNTSTYLRRSASASRCARHAAGCGRSRAVTLPAWGTTSGTWNCVISCGRPPKPPSSTSYLDAKKQEIWKRAPWTCPRFPNFPIRMRRCPPAAAQAISWALPFSERAGSSHPAAPQRLTQTDGRPAPRGQTPDRPPPLGAAPQTNGGGGTGDGPRAGSGVGREETTPARTSPRRAPGLLRRAAHAHSWRRTPLRPWEARWPREGGWFDAHARWEEAAVFWRVRWWWFSPGGGGVVLLKGFIL